MKTFRTVFITCLLTGWIVPLGAQDDDWLLDDLPEADEEVLTQPTETPPADPALQELLFQLDDIDEPAVPPEAPVTAPVETPPVATPPVAAEQVETPPADPAATRPADTESAAIAMQEEVRRQALEFDARRRLSDARQAAENKEYGQSLREYDLSLQRMPVRPETEQLIETIHRERAEVMYHVLMERFRTATRAQLDEIIEDAGRALKVLPDHRGLPRLIRAAERRIEELAPPPSPPTYATPAIEARRQRVRQTIEDARGFLRTGDLGRAQELFESVLSIEPDNLEAMRYLQELHRQRYQIGTLERDATQRDMVATVRETWRPREYQDIETDEVAPDIRPEIEDLEGKMSKIMIPEIEFRQANIHDVVDFLVRASIEGDPQRRGVNIILNLQAGSPRREPTGMDRDDPFRPGVRAQPDTVAMPGADITVTFTARHISLLQALRIITQVAGLKYHIEDNIVMIVTEDAVIDRIIHRMYPVEPSLMELVERERATAPAADPFRTSMGPGGIAMERPPVQQFFEQMGVKFPAGSSIAYRSSIGKLVVANTAENLAVFERILGELNVVPVQVEVEARFVEINQTDIEEFGLQWLLEDNWQLLQRSGQENLPLNSRERIEVRSNADRGGFTRGLRFSNPGGEMPIGGGAGTLGSIMTISSVLTNPEFSLIINALAQKGHADVLSAPRITTRSGEEATIRVVTEYTYPTDYDMREVTGTMDGQQVVLDAFTIPSAFATREVGVILSVLPEVSQDGNMINLTLRPEVTDEPIWRNYGAVIRRADGSEQATNMEQPFFPTRTLTTQISIYDGATVVMGGLINEQLITSDDKIPFLGDIPLLGRLFRSTTKRSTKRNLMIFVTARLVDPAGRPIRQPRAETATAEM